MMVYQNVSSMRQINPLTLEHSGPDIIAHTVRLPRKIEYPLVKPLKIPKPKRQPQPALPKRTPVPSRPKQIYEEKNNV